jgi:beta-galactosidase/beta-glucuronidase
MKLKLIGSLLMLALPALAQQHIDLSGEWQFRSERETGVVRLPGSMLTNGKGDEVTVNTKWTSSLYDSSFYFNPYMARYRRAGHMKFPFFLTPDKHYVGNAWYERTVMVPKRWKGKPVVLYLERPHIETTVLVNGKRVGHQQSLSAPHVYDVTPYIIYGKPNQLTIQVYNGIENVCVGQDSHSVTDQTQGNWNGIVGKIELRQGPNIWRKCVVPDIANGIVTITINEATYRLPLGSDTVRWDEFHPQLYTRTVKYQGMPVNVTFGLRELRVDGARMLINNRPMYLPRRYQDHR